MKPYCEDYIWLGCPGNPLHPLPLTPMVLPHGASGAKSTSLDCPRPDRQQATVLYSHQNGSFSLIFPPLLAQKHTREGVYPNKL